MPMLFTLVDPSALGRLDYLSMSQQALMECLVAQINETSLRNFLDENKNFKDIDEWTGVKCNDEGDVVKIDWVNEGHYAVNGSIDFQWIPPKVQNLKLRSYTPAQPLTGSLDIHMLPRSLQTFHINIFHIHPTEKIAIRGSFSDLPESMKVFNNSGCIVQMPLCLIGIPKRLKDIYISGHDFGDINLRCGSAALTGLILTKGNKQGTISFLESPPSLLTLDLKENKLVGSVSLQGLPDCLERISLSDNNFQGSIVFENVPPSLQFINMHNTKFEKMIFNTALPNSLKLFYAKNSGTSGTIDFRHFSKETETILISENQLSGSVQIDHLVKAHRISASENRLEGSVDLRNLPNQLHALNLSANQLTGTVDLRALSPLLRELYLQNNNLTGSFFIESLPPNLLVVNLANNQFEMEVLVVPVGAKNLPTIDIKGNGVKKVTNAQGRKLRPKTIAF